MRNKNSIMMKKPYLLYALLCITIFGNVKAADLYVRDLGAGGAYATISAAISAANDGDRIIIRPKTGNVPYLENLTINKSLTFTSEINFSKYYVKGDINLVPAVNRVITINNMYAFQSSIATSAVTLSGGRATVNIINCTVDQNIDLDNSKNVTANVTQSSCKELSFVHGKVTANSISNLTLNDDTAPLASSDVQIIANGLYTNTEFTNAIKITTTSYPIKIFNNDAQVQGINSIYISPAITIYSIKAGSTNIVQNNRFRTNHTSATISYLTDTMSISGTNSGIINIANNIFENSSSYSYHDHIDAGAASIATVIANNNLCPQTCRMTGVDIANGNINNGVYTLNQYATPPLATGDIVNAGLAGEEYQDLDLTVNDIGPLGGSNSWVNYWPSNAGNKPRVMFLETPRVIYQGTTTIQAEATGISK